MRRFRSGVTAKSCPIGVRRTGEDHENAALGITVNAILPGLVATEQVLAMPAEVRERIMQSLPSGRAVEPEEIAAAVSFLASRDSAQITGQEVAVDGGSSLNTASLAGRRAAPD